MVLIKCPECGKMISDKAQFCVECGYPVYLMFEESSEQGYYEIDETNMTQEEFEKLKQKAENGDVEAQWEITNYYWDEDDEKKMHEAVKWLKIAANNGHPEAQYILACIYNNGEVIKKIKMRPLSGLNCLPNRGILMHNILWEQYIA